MNQLWLCYHTYGLRAKVFLLFCSLSQEFDEDESVAAEHSFFESRQPAWSISDAGDLFFQRKMRFELDLQDDVLTKASAMISRMKVLSTFARRAGNASQSDLWELRIEELESIIATAGKRAAAAYAKSFYSGRSGFSSLQQIELNKRARQCYKASRRNCSSSDSGSSSDSDYKKRTGKSGPKKMKSGKKVHCFACGNLGHVATKCPQKQKPSYSRPQNSGFQRKCLLCGETTHMAAKCPLNPVNKSDK